MIIYKTTNIVNGKIYIGQDLHNNKKYLGSGKILKTALIKYGKENFVKEILEECNNKEQLNEREKFWIEKFNSRNRKIGYNISSGGVYGDTITTNPNKNKIIEKIKKSNKGKKRSDEVRQKISESLKGHIVSQKTRNKIKKTRKERNIKPSKKSIEGTIKRLKKNYSNENNLNAKTFYLISPDGKNFKIKGQLPTFCKEYKINVTVLRNYVNKGKIPPTNRRENEVRTNTVGWEIKTSLGVIGKYDKYYYELISPESIKYTLYHGLRKFCKTNIISYDCLIINMNKGKIKPPTLSFTKERINTTNWEIKKILPIYK